MNVFLHSLGCKVNLADAAAVVGEFEGCGLRLVDDVELAQVILLNTCTVTHKADRDVRKFLSAMGKKHAGLPVLVTGCASRLHADSLAGFSNVAAVMLPGDPAAIAEKLAQLTGATGPKGERELLPDSPFFAMRRSRAFLKVQDGCDAHCRYCIIPRVRGRPRSVARQAVLAAATALVEAGHGEIVLCGIHLGRYGVDLSPAESLADLIVALDEVFAGQRPCRLRLSSVEPLEWSEDLLRRISERPWICRHFHVPLQSLDDGVLKAMGRPYSAGQALDVLDTIKQGFPDALLGTDILVGFPGEDERQALQNLEALEQSPVEHLHVFTYSARPGTIAADLPGQVPARLVRERAAVLRRLGRARWKAFLKRGLGQAHQVLVERGDRGLFQGHSEHYRPFVLRAASELVLELGSLVRVRAEKLVERQLEGVVSSSAPT